MPMSSKLAAFLATIGQAANGIGAFLLSADKVPFGLDAHDVGLSMVWAGTIATIIVLAIRRNVIPGIETGIGTELQGTTKTTTLETTTKVNP